MAERSTHAHATLLFAASHCVPRHTPCTAPATSACHSGLRNIRSKLTSTNQRIPCACHDFAPPHTSTRKLRAMTAHPNSNAVFNARELRNMTTNLNRCAIFNARELRAFTANRNSRTVPSVHALRTLTANHNSSAVPNAHTLRALTANHNGSTPREIEATARAPSALLVLATPLGARAANPRRPHTLRPATTCTSSATSQSTRVSANHNNRA